MVHTNPSRPDHAVDHYDGLGCSLLPTDLDKGCQTHG